MPRDGWTPIGNTGWYQVSEEEAAELRELDKVSAANEKVRAANKEALAALWQDLLREHPGEVVLVTDAGATVRFFPGWAALNAAAPWEEYPNAAIELLEDPPPILIV